MVLGVTRLQDLQEIVTAYSKDIPETNYSQYVITDEKYINPSMWQVKK